MGPTPIQFSLLLVFVAVAAATATNNTNITQLVLVDASPSRGVIALIGSVMDTFVPQDSHTLWSAVWVYALINHDPFLNYVSSTFFWFDSSLALLLDNAACSPSHFQYCAEAQLLTAFYMTLITAVIGLKMNTPHVSTVGIFLLSYVIALMVLIDSASCTWQGTITGSILGALLGMIRVLFYMDFQTT